MDGVDERGNFNNLFDGDSAHMMVRSSQSKKPITFSVTKTTLGIVGFVQPPPFMSVYLPLSHVRDVLPTEFWCALLSHTSRSMMRSN